MSTAERMAAWRQANPERARAAVRRLQVERGRWYHLKSEYGVTEFQFDRMYTEQGGKCAGCQKQLAYPSGALLDHDHATGKPRGLLCAPCNTMLGYVKDNPQTLRNLAAYLERQVELEPEPFNLARPPKYALPAIIENL